MSEHALATKTWTLTRGGAGSHTVSRNRFAGRKAPKATPQTPPDPGLRLCPEAMPIPLGWGISHRILVDVDSDLFQPRIPLAYQYLAWETMARARWHTFVLITRQPTVQRSIAELFNREPLPNLWLGVQIEHRAGANLRLAELRSTPAAVRFASFDPLKERLGPLDLEGIDWVIVAGEGGARPRPLHPEWVRELRDQCLCLGLPFCFKGWGGYPVARVLDGRLWDERPPLAACPNRPLRPRRRQLRWQIRRAVAFMYPPKPLERCPVCRCCAMVAAPCVYCRGTGTIDGAGIPAAFRGPCLQCRATGEVAECGGGCTPYDHHGEREQLALFTTAEPGGGQRYATAGF